MGYIVITSLLLYTFIILFNTRLCSCNVNSPNNLSVRCKPSERAALLNFKRNFTYFNKDVSSSWEGEECCNWTRVVCDTTTGHILELNLNGDDDDKNLLKMEKLESMVYLLELRQLEKLDLSFNDFNYSSIPMFIGSMKQLRYLNLSSASLSGLIPYELGNLTNLELLGLTDNQLSGKIPTSIGKLSKLQTLDISYNPLEGVILSEPRFANLSSLTYLGMDETMLTLNLSSDWVPPFQLQYLSASNCKINGQLPPWLQIQKNLSTLYLSNANISGLMPSWFHTMQQLNTVVLSNNNLSGSPIFPINFNTLVLSNNSLSGEFLSNRTNTEVYGAASLIDFTSNFISGQIPEGLGHIMPNLEYLFLSNNQISGQIPTSLGKLSKLQILDISFNPLEDTILSETHFANLSSLTDLYMGETMLTLNLSSDWVPPFQLQDFYADTCKINGQFPPWLQTQKNLSDLYLSDANISGHMPFWFHTMQQLDFVTLSNNKLSGSPIFPINFIMLVLSNNSLSGEFMSNGSKTRVYHSANFVNVADNFISGPLPDGLGHLMPNLGVVDISNNQISGQIPNSLCQLKLLYLIDIRNNSISGEIPNCFANLSSLSFVGLSYNKLMGHIPCFNKTYSYGNSFGPFIEFYLHLNDNMLNGEIPSCLSDLTNLKVLDIGENQLSGQMFKWFNAEKFRELQIFRLRGNKFSGTIPEQICSLPHLQILDLGHNHFTGSIPPCLSNLTSMTSPNPSQMTEKNEVIYDVSEVIQGIEYAYTRTLAYLVDIDLSFNNLMGSIPDDMTKISGLLNLNLSYNKLSGTIPVNIGGLKSLVSLDLSNNNLMGSIPTSIGQIYRLSHLNLSYNNLSGPIPTGNQLQTLPDQALIYAENLYLCGDFLPVKCKSKVDEQDKGMGNKGKGNNKEKLEKMEFGLVVMSGFATGFWGVVGGLALNRRWRHAVFRRVEDGYNWFYVIVAVRVAKVRRNNRR